MGAELGLPITPAADVEAAVAEADIVCTVTAAREPILKGGLGAARKPRQPGRLERRRAGGGG